MSSSRYVELPVHILERIFETLSQNERVRLGSTCRGLELIGRPSFITYRGSDRTIDSMCQWLFHHAEALDAMHVRLEKVTLPTKRKQFGMAVAAFACRVRHLDVCAPEDTHFSWIESMHSLESLRLVGSEFNTHEGFFASLRELTSLTLVGCLAHNETYTSHLGDIVRLQKLRELTVTGVCYDVCLCSLALMPHLEKLVIRGDADNCSVIRTVSSLSSLTNLRHVELDAYSGVDVWHLQGLVNLTSLHLSSRGLGMGDDDEHIFNATGYAQFANALPYLNVLGCSDASLVDVSHPTLELLQLTMTSLLESVQDGMTLTTLPHITTLEIREAFRESLKLDMHRGAVIRFLQSNPRKDLVVHLITAYDGDMCTDTIASWMNIAADLEKSYGVHFLIE